MTALKFFLRTFFGFSAREVNGFLVMAVLMLIFLALPPSLDLLLAKPSNGLVKQSAISHSIRQDTLFAFDPNTVSRNALLQLGFSEKLADRLIKFRNAKGQFRKKTDLLKLYGMDTLLYTRLQDSIHIIKSANHTASTTSIFQPYAKRNTSTVLLDINVCDSSALEKLRGIGPALASRILKYRAKLGGFVDTTQYKEVYGLKDFALEELKRTTFVHAGFEPTPLLLNSCTQEELGKHPYIGWKAAKLLVNYRVHHGSYNSMEDVLNSKALTEEGIRKVQRYIKLQ